MGINYIGFIVLIACDSALLTWIACMLREIVSGGFDGTQGRLEIFVAPRENQQQQRL